MVEPTDNFAPTTFGVETAFALMIGENKMNLIARQISAGDLLFISVIALPWLNPFAPGPAAAVKVNWGQILITTI